MNTHQFPSYIGFGKLRPEKISENNNEITADYYFLDRPVHRISVIKNGNPYYHMTDLPVDEGISSSSAKLNTLAIFHFNGLDCTANPVFAHVRQQVCGLGNIYFENFISWKDNSPIYSCHPAGKIALLRLPCSQDEDRLNWLDNEFENERPHLGDGEENLFYPVSFYPSRLIVTDHHGSKSIRNITMSEFVVPIAYLYDACKWLSEEGIIEKEYVMRLLVQDVGRRTHNSIQIFPPNKTNGFPGYKIFLQGTDGKEKFEQTISEIDDHTHA
jgi:hypothetical protein